MHRALLLFLAIFVLNCSGSREVDLKIREIVRSLLDPAKLESLRPRSASDRIDKVMYWLSQTPDPGAVMAAVVGDIGWAGTSKGDLLVNGILRNLETLKSFGCLTPENLELLRRGGAPTITQGEYAGQIVELDHIVPVAHAPHWSNVISNHQYLPKTLNRSKGDKMGEVEFEFERILKDAGF